MMAHPNTWLVFSIIAAVVWGFSYAFSERLMKDGLPPLFVMAFAGVMYMFVTAILAAWTGGWKEGWTAIRSDHSLFYKLMFIGCLHAVGAGLVFYAINMKNATLASLVEITYPVFVCLFAYVLYKDVQVNMWTALGGLMIFSGVATIYLKA